MQTETLPYSEGDAAFDIFVARPVQAGPRPAVLVCHAWGGRDEFAEGRAEALGGPGDNCGGTDPHRVGRGRSGTPGRQRAAEEGGGGAA